LQPYTQEKVYATTASKDFHLFYVGRDDVHGILKHVLSRVSVSLYLNMFGFDDDELNEILKKIAVDPTITMLVTLDKSQAGGAHEKALLDADRKADLALFNTHVAIGQSLTHQISHTKGFVADGKVAGEGSTNWSVSGEGAAVGGTFNTKATGFKAQNNTQSIITDPDTISRFTAELIAEHMIAQQQASDAKTVEAVNAVKAAAKK
jgi:phosphatidylserine/phosphatidylglycerophosphate/cardiolipin synthase-like enzyme